MSKPILAMIPSAYNTNRLYSVLPFDGSGDFAFNRTGSATRVNKDGLIETVASNVPRLDYADGSCPSLLLEPQRTNNIKYSEDFTVADWQKYNVGNALTPIIEENYAISPDGSFNATRLKLDLNGGNTSSDRTFIRQFLNIDSGYYFSVYLKSNTNENQKILWHNGGDINEFTITNEWERYELNTSLQAISWAGLALRGGVSTVDSADVLIWGFQVEQGSYPTSYIPTIGTAITRSADNCYGAGNPNLFDITEGTMYFELSKNGLEPISYSGLSLSDSSLSNRIELRYAPNSNTLQMVVRISSAAVVVLNYTLSDVTEKHKVAITFKTNDYALWVNGARVGTDTSGTLPSGLRELAFDDGSGANDFYGNVHDARVYNKILSTSELVTLTTL